MIVSILKVCYSSGMNQPTKMVRILAIVALGFILVFSVTLIMSFLEFGGLASFIICIVSGLIGVGLFTLIKYKTKTPKDRPPHITVPDIELEEPKRVEPDSDVDKK